MIDYNKIPQIEISRIFGQVGAELIHSVTRTVGEHDGGNGPFARLQENMTGRRIYVKNFLASV